LEHSGLGAAISDGKGVIKKSNKSLQKLLGYSEDALMSKSFSDLVHSEDQKSWDGQLESVADGKLDHDSWQGRLNRKDKTSVWAKVTMSALRRSDGPALTV